MINKKKKVSMLIQFISLMNVYYVSLLVTNNKTKTTLFLNWAMSMSMRPEYNSYRNDEGNMRIIEYFLYIIKRHLHIMLYKDHIITIYCRQSEVKCEKLFNFPIVKVAWKHSFRWTLTFIHISTWGVWKRKESCAVSTFSI